MEARRYNCTISTLLAPQDPQVVHARPLYKLLADGLRGPAFVAREAPRRLRGALGEALVVVGLAEEAVAVPVGALVRHFYQFDAVAAQEPKFRTDWYWAGLWSCFLGASAVRAALSWMCALNRKAWTCCARRCARNSSLANYFSGHSPSVSLN